MTPSARSLKLLRAAGYAAQVVEKWQPQSRRRVDLFNIGDILAIKAGQPVLMIQCTTGSNLAARRTKAMAEAKLSIWLAAGGAFELWAWRKAGPRGKRKLWRVKREAIGVADLSIPDPILTNAPKAEESPAMALLDVRHQVDTDQTSQTPDDGVGVVHPSLQTISRKQAIIHQGDSTDGE